MPLIIARRHMSVALTTPPITGEPFSPSRLSSSASIRGAGAVAGAGCDLDVAGATERDASAAAAGATLRAMEIRTNAAAAIRRALPPKSGVIMPDRLTADYCFDQIADSA